MSTFLLHGFKLVRDPEYLRHLDCTSTERNLESLALLSSTSEGCASVAATILLGNVPSKDDATRVANAAAMVAGLTREAIEIIETEAAQ